MNNTLCLGIFCALVYFKDLEWYYSAGEFLHFTCFVITLLNPLVVGKQRIQLRVPLT